MAPDTTASMAGTAVAPLQGLRSATVGHRRSSNAGLGNVPNNGGRIRCMQVWPIEGKKKFEMLSYLPSLPVEALLKQIEYLICENWIPCLEFSKVTFQEHETGALEPFPPR